MQCFHFGDKGDVQAQACKCIERAGMYTMNKSEHLWRDGDLVVFLPPVHCRSDEPLTHCQRY